MSAIWTCRKCLDATKDEERYDTDQFMAHLRDVHHQTVLSVYDGILIGSTHVRPKGSRPPESEVSGQATLPYD